MEDAQVPAGIVASSGATILHGSFATLPDSPSVTCCLSAADLGLVGCNGSMEDKRRREWGRLPQAICGGYQEKGPPTLLAAAEPRICDRWIMRSDRLRS
jgi:hypothetical protein